MKVVSFTQARNNLKLVLDEVSKDSEFTIISRRQPEDAVVMTLDYFNGLMSTKYLLGNHADAKHLIKSIDQFKKGKIKTNGSIDG